MHTELGSLIKEIVIIFVIMPIGEFYFEKKYNLPNVQTYHKTNVYKKHLKRGNHPQILFGRERPEALPRNRRLKVIFFHETQQCL